MADSEVVRIEGEAKELLENMVSMERPRVSMSNFISKLVYDEWERRASQPNPDMTIEQAEGVA